MSKHRSWLTLSSRNRGAPEWNRGQGERLDNHWVLPLQSMVMLFILTAALGGSSKTGKYDAASHDFSLNGTA